MSVCLLKSKFTKLNIFCIIGSKIFLWFLKSVYHKSMYIKGKFMRVDSVSGYVHQPLINGKIGRTSVNSAQGHQVSTAGSVVLISFTGGAKNINQIASLTPENNGLGLPEAGQGGEGCVGYELPASLRKHEGKDARSFMPYWEYNNPKGGHVFLIHTRKDFPDGVSSLPDTMPVRAFYHANIGETLEDVAKKQNLSPDELSYVIQSKPNAQGLDAQSKYCILEPTSVKGEIKAWSEESLADLKSVPYQLMKVSEHNPSYNRLKGEPHYFVYTPELARASKPYSYDCHGNAPFAAEIINTNEMKVIAKMITHDMNTEEFGYFNPASVLAHDRVAHPFANHVANMSAHGDEEVNGLKIHIVEHNSGRNYQGLTSDPFEFLRLVGDETDAAALKKHPQFPTLLKVQKYGIFNADALSKRERDIAWSVLEPALRPFRDGSGTYNVLKTGIAGVKTNPDNVSLGTVSYTFDSEMKSHETPNAAPFLTDDFASIETKSVLNGSTPANLKLDNPNAVFGQGDNGLTAAKDGFTTFKYDGNNIDEIVKIRQKNAQWFTNLVYNAYSSGHESLRQVFFNKKQLSEGQNVYGYLKPMKEDDILVMGWGRPDEQKGYNITLDGFKKFLERKDISDDVKMRFRLAVGAGKWNEDAKDFKSIKRLVKEISEMDGGKYNGLVMYVDGYFPNRLVGCAQYGMFTSRREMCGITPLECKAAGVPYGTTGSGPADYTNDSNGFLTKSVEGKPERYGLTWNNTADEIDDARCSAAADEISEVYVKMADEHTNFPNRYLAKCKKNIEEKIDWHENAEYNHGKSANQLYMDDIFEMDKGWEARSKRKMRPLMQAYGDFVDKGEEILQQSAKSKPLKIIFAIVGAAAVITGGYLFYQNRKTKQATENKVDKVA